jgi:hypothetical protein
LLAENNFVNAIIPFIGIEVNKNEIEKNKYLADEVYPACAHGIAEETKSADYDFQSRYVYCRDGDNHNVAYCPI